MLLISGTAEVELAWAQGRLATDDHRLTSVHGDAMVFSRIKHLVCYTHNFCFPVLLTCVIFFLTFIKSTVHWRRSRMWRGQVPQIWSGGANIDAPQSFCLYDTFIFLYNAAISFSLESYSAGDTELETYSWVWRETDQGNPLKCIHTHSTPRLFDAPVPWALVLGPLTLKWIHVYGILYVAPFACSLMHVRVVVGCFFLKIYCIIEEYFYWSSAKYVH